MVALGSVVHVPASAWTDVPDGWYAGTVQRCGSGGAVLAFDDGSGPFEFTHDELREFEKMYDDSDARMLEAADALMLLASSAPVPDEAPCEEASGSGSAPPAPAKEEWIVKKGGGMALMGSGGVMKLRKPLAILF